MPASIVDLFDELPPPPPSPIPELPAHLCKIGGFLDDYIDWYMDTAQIPNLLFALSSAITFASTVCGRYLCTDEDNYPTLFMMAVGKSGIGKEYAVQSVARALNDCDLALGENGLLGPRRFTSEAGLLSALAIKPKMVILVDEYGIFLKNSRQSKDTSQEEVLSIMMQIFNRLDGTITATQGSTRNKTPEQIKADNDRFVEHPATAFLTATTPSTLYSALSMLDVKTGLLSRFLVFETTAEREDYVRKPKKRKLPDSVIKWAHRMNDPFPREDLIGFAPNGQSAPDPVVIPFHPATEGLKQQLRIRQNRLMDKYEDFGFEEVFNRAREMSMRLSLIVSLSRGEKWITPASLRWSADLVFTLIEKQAERYRSMIGHGEMETVAKVAAEAVLRAGKKGYNRRELAKYCRDYARLDERDTSEVERRMSRDFQTPLVQIKGKRGPASQRFIHEKFLN